MPFYVYILKSSRDGQYYIEQSSDINLRLRRHNEGSSRYTKGRGPWELVHQESYATRSEAMCRERILKGLKRRDLIERIIKENNEVAVAQLAESRLRRD